MKYTPRPATFHLEWYRKPGTDEPIKSCEAFANEADAHIFMAELFEKGIKTVVFEKSVVYEVEK